MAGMVRAPTAATVAGPEPEMAPKNMQVTTAVMQYGYRIIDDLKDGLARYLAAHEKHLSDIIGGALKNFVEADRLDRHSIAYPVLPAPCTGCGRCFIACDDAGHQAIAWDAHARTVSLDKMRCVGCGLCALVCPTGEIVMGERVHTK